MARPVLSVSTGKGKENPIGSVWLQCGVHQGVEGESDRKRQPESFRGSQAPNYG